MKGGGGVSWSCHIQFVSRVSITNLVYTHVYIVYTHVYIVYTHVAIVYTHVNIVYNHVTIVYVKLIGIPHEYTIHPRVYSVYIYIHVVTAAAGITLDCNSQVAEVRLTLCLPSHASPHIIPFKQS